jgi:hypothetical protein
LKETKKCDESRQLNIGHLLRDRVELKGNVGAPSISMTSENEQNDQSKCQYELLEKIISNDNLNEAYKRVKRNKGSHGVDKMGVDELLTYLKDNGNQLKQSILDGNYNPCPVRRVEIPKPDGKKKLKEKLKSITGRSNAISIEMRALKIKQTIIGWVEYFKLADMKNVLKVLDEWLRRRIRMCYWKQWKKIKTKHDNLVKLGIENFKSWEFANTRKGYWRISNSPILSRSLTNQYLKEQGFITMSERYLRVS